ncbi:MAG: hypothetical protein HOK71_12930, partial [Planctomycetaceae bacterium]|nr:hypothetical protein [Planctomycetaceae bacterium]
MFHRSNWAKTTFALTALLLLLGTVDALAVKESGTSRQPAGSSSPTAEQTPVNLFLPAETDDAGWPFVRGPNYDGHSAEINLADSWP